MGYGNRGIKIVYTSDNTQKIMFIKIDLRKAIFSQFSGTKLNTIFSKKIIKHFSKSALLSPYPFISIRIGYTVEGVWRPILLSLTFNIYLGELRIVPHIVNCVERCK